MVQESKRRAKDTPDTKRQEYERNGKKVQKETKNSGKDLAKDRKRHEVR